jgi:hypothetical protein
MIMNAINIALLYLILFYLNFLCVTKNDVNEERFFVMNLVHLKGEYMISTKLTSRY